MNDKLIAVEKASSLTADDPELRVLAARIKALLPNGDKLSDTEALAGAQYAKATGLNPFAGEFYIVPGIGVVPGYKGELVKQAQSGLRPRYQYRRPTEEEMAWHDIQPGDKAVICVATELNDEALARQEGREPRVWIGVGIVREHEMWKSYEWVQAPSGRSYKRPLPREKWTERLDPPNGRSWGWVAQNRAMKDAARHMGLPLPPTPEEILLEARAAGVQIDVPPNAQLTSEQAEAAVRTALAEHRRQLQPPSEAELAAHLARTVEVMRGPRSDDPLGIDAAPAEAPESPAERIRRRILQRVAELGGDQPADPDLLRRANAALALLIPNQERRRAVRQYWFGTSEMPLTRGQAAAIREFAAVRGYKDENGRTVYAPVQRAVDEIEITLAAIMPSQPTLFKAAAEGEGKKEEKAEETEEAEEKEDGQYA